MTAPVLGMGQGDSGVLRWEETSQLRPQILDFGFWILDFGLGELGIGNWELGITPLLPCSFPCSPAPCFPYAD